MKRNDGMKTGDLSADPIVGLSRNSYMSPAQFQHELLAIHHVSWLYGCHASEVGLPGEFVTRQVGRDDSIIIVRGEDGQVRAFANLCRHRGSRLCHEDHGHVRRLVCPYHQWRYATDGNLLSANRMRDGIDLNFADHGLVAIAAETWGGHVFICLSDPQAPLAPLLSAAAVGLSDYSPEATKVAARRCYPIAANWKLVMENFWECYHCAARHPEFSAIADVGGLEDTDFGTVTEPGAALSPVIGGALPLKPGFTSLTLDGRPACRRRFGRFQSEIAVSDPVQTTGFILRHSTAVTYFPDHGIVLDFQPRGVDQTLLVARWLVPADAVEGQDYVTENLVALWDITNIQDGVLAEGNAAGVRSSFYKPGPISRAHEPGIHEFHRFCAAALARTPALAISGSALSS